MEFSMRRVNALIKKEIKDFSKNVNVLFMCALPIVFGIIYSKMFGKGISTEAYIYVFTLCLAMNIVLTSAYVIAMLIAEEKEKNTLRNLMLSGVSPLEFFIGKLFITFLLSEIINFVLFFIFNINIHYLALYILLATLLVIIMMEIGAIIGIVSPNQMATGVVGMPVLMVLLMVPMFAKVNKTLKKVAEFLPNYNMNVMLEKIFKGEGLGIGSISNIAVIVAWIIITLIIFVYTYNKVGLDN